MQGIHLQILLNTLFRFMELETFSYSLGLDDQPPQLPRFLQPPIPSSFNLLHS